MRFLPQHEPSPENVRTALLAAKTTATAMTMPGWRRLSAVAC